MIKIRRHRRLPPSAKPMQEMLDAGLLTEPPKGRIPIDYTPEKPIVMPEGFVWEG